MRKTSAKNNTKTAEVKHEKCNVDKGETKISAKRGGHRPTKNAVDSERKSPRKLIAKKYHISSNQTRIDSYFKICAKPISSNTVADYKQHHEQPQQQQQNYSYSLRTRIKSSSEDNETEFIHGVRSENVPLEVYIKSSQKSLNRRRRQKETQQRSREKMTDATKSRLQRKRKFEIDDDPDEVIEVAVQSNIVDVIDLCQDDDDDDDANGDSGNHTESKSDKENEKANNCEIKNIYIQSANSIQLCLIEETARSPPLDLSPSSTSTKKHAPAPVSIVEEPIATTSSKATARGKRKTRPCPAYKCVEGTSFAVDAFNYGYIENVKYYFLTHFHADHYVGLTTKFDKPIYLSAITARLVRTFIPVADKYLHIIPLDDEIIVDGVKIMAIDANHCPGAVMLLFKLSTGRCILHTGDFRANWEMESHPAFWNNDIHTIYLDTTYISNRYNFCTQSESIDAAKDIIRQFKVRNASKRILYVCGSYVIGKEKFWLALAQEFKLRVWAEGSRKKALDVMQMEALENRLCDNPLNAEMHIIPMMKLTYPSMCEYFNSSLKERFDVVLAIRPSGWEKNSRPRWGKEISIVGIEYSEHSSYDEIKRFVSYLKPKKVISTVPVGKNPSVTGGIPLSWYKYDKLRPQSNKQQSILNYMTMIKSPVAVPKKSYECVNVSPIKSHKNGDDAATNCTKSSSPNSSLKNNSDADEIENYENAAAPTVVPTKSSPPETKLKLSQSAKRSTPMRASNGVDTDSDWMS